MSHPFLFRPFSADRAATTLAILSRAFVWSQMLLALLLVGRVAVAVEAPLSGRPPRAAYRLIYVPDANLDAWPREGEKYLPIESDQFRALIEAANRQLANGAPRATIRQAEYSGRLEGDRLAGHGEWTVVLRGEGPALLPVDRRSVVLRNAHWLHDAEIPARWGIWGASGAAADQLGLEVSRSGSLEFDWYTPLQGPPHGRGAVWQLPGAMTSRLTLDLPLGKQPALEGGVVLDERPLPQEAAEPKDSPAYRRWDIAMNPRSPALVYIADTQSAPAQTPPALSYRDDLAYHVTERGVEIIADVHIDASVSEVREVVVSMPADVRLLSAVAEGEELAWRTAVDAGAAATKALIEIPTSIARRSLTVSLRAWQPLVTNEPRQLPRLHAQDAFWTYGTLKLTVAPTLELQRLEPSQCVQTGVNLESQSGTGAEAFWFASYSSDANLTMTVGRRAPQVSARLGSSLALTEHDLNGRLVTRLNVRRGSVHTLTGRVARGWIAESVETIPADAMGEWSVERRNGRNRIEIQLAQGANPDRSATVVIEGRFQLPGIAESIRREALRMVSWDGVEVAQHLLTFQAVEPYAAEHLGDWSLVAPDTLSDDDLTLLDPVAAQGPVLDLAQAARNMGLRVAIERGRYEADILLDSTVDGQQLQQTFRIMIHPRRGRIDRILLQATRPLGDEVRWVERSSGAPLAAERVTAGDPRAVNGPAGSELWRLRLPHPIAGPIELVGTRFAAWSPPLQLPLLALPDAGEQRGRVVVRGGLDPLPLVEPQRMQPISLPLDPIPQPGATGVGPQPPVRLAYRYDPTDCQLPVGRPALALRQGVADDTRGIVADRAEFDSFYMPDGRVFHRAMYELENQSAEGLELRLPPGARLQSATIDGRAAKVAATESSDATKIRVALGPGPTSLTAHFEMQQSPLAMGLQLAPPLLEQGFPVLAGEWTVWLPAEFTAAGLGGQDFDLSWRQRLFGPLGRSAGTRPFNPLRAADWAAIADGLPLWLNALVDSERDATLGPVPPADLSRRTSPVAEELGLQEGKFLEEPLAGWTAYRTSFVAHGPNALVVAHPPVSAAWGIGAFLSALVVGGALWRRRSRLAVMLLVVAAVSCLWLPPVFTSVATGALLGGIASRFVGWASVEASDERSTRTLTGLPTRALISLAMCAAVGSATLGQPPADVAPTEAVPSSHADKDAAKSVAERSTPPTVHRVLVPLGEDGRRTGTKYYVSERFLRELTRSAEQEHAANRHWMLLDAAYRGQLRQRAGGDGIAAGSWTLTFELEVFARDTTIVLPLVRAEADWAADATLDGIPADIEWNPDEQSCAVEVSEPGRYQLSLSCVPQTRATDGRHGVALTIPPVLDASLQLDYPAGIAGLKVMGAAIATGKTDSSGAATLELNRSNRLVVDWPQAGPPDGDAAGMRVTELCWLHVSATDVVLETKYIVEGGGRGPETLAVEFDDHWRLLPGEAIRPADRAALPEGRGAVRVALREGVDRREVTLRWRLTGVESLGRMRLSPIELTSLPVAERWIAVSSGAELECELTGSDGASGGSTNEFLAMWGEPDSAGESLAVFTNWSAGAEWLLAVRPRPVESTVDQVTHVAAGIDGLRVQYEAQVAPGRNDAFQFSLAVPAELVVDEIALSHSGRRVPIRWARAADSINVFFSQRAAGSYRLTLIGHVPANASATYRLPRISAATEADAARVQLYRQPGAVFDVAGIAADAQLHRDAFVSAPPLWNARRVSALELDGREFATARLVVKPNRVETVGQTLMALSQDRKGWQASFTCQLTIGEGLLDELRLRVPAGWTGPFVVESGVPATLERISAGDGQALLAIRFATAIMPGETVRLEIRAPVAAETAAPLSVPQVAVESDSGWRHFVMVPAAIGGHALEWTEAGVRPAETRPELAPTDSASDTWRTYEVVDQPYQVTLRPTIVARPEAMVRLADTVCVVGESGGRLFVTRLVVTSHGLTECVLQLPRGQQLISVRADGSPAPAHRLSEAQWRLPLGPAHLPQFLEIVTRSNDNTPPSRRRFELTRPNLLVNNSPMPVEVSLWTVGHALKSARPGVHGAEVVPAADQDALRLDRLVSISEAATAVAAESPPPDGRDWYRRWIVQLQALREESLSSVTGNEGEQAELNIVLPSQEELVDASERLDAWIARSNEMLALSDTERRELELTIAEGRTDAVLGRERAIAASIAALPDQEWIHCVAEGAAPRLVVDMTPISATPSQVRVVGLLAIVGAAVAVVWLLHAPAARDWVERWPQTFVFLFGLTYWAWLWPSWLGLLIAAVGVLLAVWPGVSLQSFPAEGSTVVRRGQSSSGL